MNTQGWIRGLIAFNSPLDKFLTFVTNTISKEFEFEANIIKDDNSYILCFDKYKIEILKKDITNLQKKGPYALDKYLLESFKKQGLKFDYHRSQYIEYCYGIMYSSAPEV